ncbi:MAG: hypothetical protein ACHQ0Y_14780 [Thermodesulfovibrionales bacterium]
MELVGSAIEITSAWLFGLMVFFMKPLNDAADDASKSDYYRGGNIRLRVD